jgi:ribulose-5-phosphate 4-epimerase/fuculose-1-phosphate aldolase
MSDAMGELAAMGRRLGGLEWVQGPGGNVSIKAGSELWVKASGKRLRDVAREDGFARVPLDVAGAALEGDAAADASLFAREPRPSMEAYFHALPARVVAHTHSLGSLLFGCAADTTGDLLGGLIRELPYIRPGRGIAVALREAWDPNAQEQAFLLRSHGMVIFAPDAKRAIALSEQVNARARERFPGLPPFEPLAASFVAAPASEVAGGWARRVARRSVEGPPRYLFPDMAVYATALVVDRITDEKAQAAQGLRDLGRSLVIVDRDGARVVAARSRPQLDDACEILAAHDFVEAALGARGAFLPGDEPGRIVQMPSEQYRMQLPSRGWPPC